MKRVYEAESQGRQLHADSLVNNEVSESKNVNADAACKDVASIKYDMQMLQIRWKRDAQQMDAVSHHTARYRCSPLDRSKRYAVLSADLFIKKNSSFLGRIQSGLHVSHEDNSFVIFKVPICSNFFFEEFLPHRFCTFLLRSCLVIGFADSIDIMDVIFPHGPSFSATCWSALIPQLPHNDVHLHSFLSVFYLFLRRSLLF